MKIVFTSCMDAARVPQQPVWRRIATQKPDVLMLLGDQIYMDWGLSLGQAPRWKRIFSKPGGPAAFAQEMHERYRLQWQVSEFRELIAGFVQEKGPQSLLLTWDDHDFAWNNSAGEDAADPHGVPARAKTITRRLFRQFQDQLRNHPNEARYPPLPPGLLDGADETQGVEQQASFGGADVFVLDTRFYRTHRDAGPCHLLGAPGSGQRQKLLDALAQGQGLFIVAGGSPMRSKYLFSDQGWHGADSSYPEYDELIAAARAHGRPVLYLGGDIHRNAWGGRLGGDDGQVVQAVSSGAAIGRILVKRFAPSFGVLDLGAAGQVGVRFVEMDKASQWHIREVGTLQYNQQGWLAATVPQSDEFDEGYRYAGMTVDDPDVAVLCYRASKKGLPVGQPQSLPMEQLEGLYGDKLPAADVQGELPFWPEPLALSVQAGDGIHIEVTRGDGGEAGCRALMEQAFERALLAGKKSVVLYLHGFNKTFAASVDQACGLKERYPEVEPILLSWPSGEDGGLLKMLGELGEAQQHAHDLWRTLASVFALFGRLANDDRYGSLRKVVLARSLGAEALAGFFGGDRGRADNIAELWADQVCRVVLSAPATRTGHHDKWMDRLACQTVVTFNRHDRKLKPADWTQWGTLLGNSMPDQPADQALYVDCTGSPAVLNNHDYLLLDLNPRLTELNRRLLTGEAVDATAVPAGFHMHSEQWMVADGEA